MKYDTNGIPNPIAGDYPGRQEILDVHTGYSLYMLRRRKDTQMNKIEEIFEKLDEIGREVCPEGNYKLSITVSAKFVRKSSRKNLKSQHPA